MNLVLPGSDSIGMTATRKTALMILRHVLLAIWLILPLAARAEAPLRVFAAASLAGALDRAAAAWQAQGGARASIAYAGSSALARQIEQGAPADLFLSASGEWMDAVEAAGLLRAGSRREFLGNALVLARHGPGAAPVEIGSGYDLAAALGDGPLAMALTEAVPAGIYGRAALTGLGLWDEVAGKVAEAADVRGALMLVATGAAPLGVVYATDAAAEPRVSVVGAFPEGSHPPIRYPAAVVAGSGHAQAGAFLEFLSGPEAGAIFAEAGFTVPGAGP